MDKGEDRTARLMEFCGSPRTMVEIMAEFGESKHVRFSVYNLVRRQKLKNLREGSSRTKPGSFVASESASCNEETTGRFDATALVAAWAGQLSMAG